MVMPEGRIGIGAQCRLKLLDRLQGSTGVLICPPQEYVRQRARRLQLDSFFQLFRSRTGLILLEQDQRHIKVDVESRSVERFRPLQRRQRSGVLSGLEVGQAEPMLQLRVTRPAGDGLLSNLRGFSQTTQLEEALRQAAVCLQ